MMRNYPHIVALMLAVITAVLPLCAVEDQPEFFSDVNTRQIAVEALVVEISEEYTRNLGLIWNLNRNEESNAGNNLSAIDARFPFLTEPVSVPVFSDIGTAGNYTLGSVSAFPGLGLKLNGMDIGMGRLSANLRGLLQTGKAEVRAHAIAVALHDTLVTIETVDEIPFQDVKYEKDRSNLDVSFEKVGVRLSAKPQIKDLRKRRLVIDINEVNLSSVTGFVSLQNVSRPIFAKSSANTIIEMTSGETFVLGGFKTKRDVISEAGIPYLRAIPYLGYLFKRERKVVENKDILFFITPYLLDPMVSPIYPYDFQHARFLQIKDVPVRYE